MNGKPPFRANGVMHSLANHTTPQHSNDGPAHTFEMLDPTDLALIAQITKRVMELAPADCGVDATIMMMDLAMVHTRGCPLKLMQLLMSSNDDITHDVLGIGLHIDRNTGKLRGGFVPRFSVRKDY